jgi:hypothetical protein
LDAVIGSQQALIKPKLFLVEHWLRPGRDSNLIKAAWAQDDAWALEKEAAESESAQWANKTNPMFWFER